MKKRILLFVVLLLCFLVLATSCGGKGKTDGTTSTKASATTPITDPVTDPSTDPATEDTRPIYTIRWIANGKEETTQVREGDVPSHDAADGYQTESTVFTFKEWSPTPTAASKNVIYSASYSSAPRKYDITFSVNGQTTVVPTDYGTVPTYPGTLKNDKTGFTVWNKALVMVKGEDTYTAVNLLDHSERETLTLAMQSDPIVYSGNDNISIHSAAVILYLLMEQRSVPDPAIVDRILLQFESLTTGGNAPMFDCCCLWNYPIVASSITIAKETPSVWEKVPAATKERLDLIMKCFAVVGAFGTNDKNNYKTGPGLSGNFGKAWNPNYRFANVPIILFCTRYFGGKDATNQILLDFDYDAYMAKFTEYGFARALSCWGQDAFLLPDGITMAPSTKELMMNGGTAYLKYDSTNGDAKGTQSGSGVGVRSTYTYNGYGLDQPAQIMNSLYTYCFSGGAVVSEKTGNVKLVQADGSYAAEYTSITAKIIDGTKSPVEGKNGMILEYNSADGGGMRSSAVYCDINYSIYVCLLSATEELKMYNIEDYPDIFSLIYVGTTDHLYKLDHGYLSVGTGHVTEEKQSINTNSVFNTLWKVHLAPRFNTRLLEEFSDRSFDFEGTNVPDYKINGVEEGNGEVLGVVEVEGAPSGTSAFMYKTQCTWNQFRFQNMFNDLAIGQDIKISFKVKSEKKGSFLVQLQEEAKEPQHVYYNQTMVVSTEGVWTTYSFAFTYTQQMYDDGVTVLCFRFNNLGQSSGNFTTIWLDDLKIEKTVIEVNPSFHFENDGEDPEITYNGVEPQNGEVFSVVTDEAHSGTGSYRYKTQCTWNRFRFTGSFIRSNIGHEMTVTFWFKADHTGSFDVCVQQNVKDAPTKYAPQNLKVDVANQWTEYTITFIYTQEMYDAGATSLGMYFNNFGQSQEDYVTLWLDDIVIVEGELKGEAEKEKDPEDDQPKIDDPDYQIPSNARKSIDFESETGYTIHFNGFDWGLGEALGYTDKIVHSGKKAYSLTLMKSYPFIRITDCFSAADVGKTFTVSVWACATKTGSFKLEPLPDVNMNGACGSYTCTVENANEWVLFSYTFTYTQEMANNSYFAFAIRGNALGQDVGAPTILYLDDFFIQEVQPE